MPKISVVCVTNRPGSVAFLKEQLDKQTFQDFEVIVADDAKQERIPGWFQFKPRQKHDDDVWNINKAYNDALNLVTGQLVVFLQDFIWIPANGLERFWELYELYPNHLVTGVGHKAEHGLEGISEIDERALVPPGTSPGNATHYELNWASCPAHLLVEFDESLDTHYGWENEKFALKTKAPVLIDSSNRCIGLSQEECGGRPANWEEKHWNKTEGYINSRP